MEAHVARFPLVDFTEVAGYGNCLLIIRITFFFVSTNTVTFYREQRTLVLSQLFFLLKYIKSYLGQNLGEGPCLIR